MGAETGGTLAVYEFVTEEHDMIVPPGTRPAYGALTQPDPTT
ncbi:MAG: hypothetical protein ACRDFT_09875 [bacterium]